MIYKVGQKTKTTQGVNCCLCWFRFLFAVHIGNQGDVDESKVLVAYAELELSHSFDKWRGLNITNSSAELRTNVNE